MFLGNFVYSQVEKESNIVYFDLNSPQLTKSAKHSLDLLLETKKIIPGHNILIYGYADYLGTREHNDSLSSDRAMYVRDYLISKGISNNNLLICVGKGQVDRTPISGHTGYAKDRKVEIITDEQIIKKYTCIPLEKCNLFEMQRKEGEKREYHQEFINAAILKDETISLRLPNGDKYIGLLYPDGSKINKSAYIWSNGEKYIGDYKNNKKDGHGIYFWPNGDIFSGEWIADSVISGELKIVSCNQLYPNYNFRLVDSVNLKWIGFDGRDSVRLSVSDRCKILCYKGKFKQAKKDGYGTDSWLYLSDKKEVVVYAGTFKDDLRQGHGILTLGNYNYDGEWRNGKENGNGKAEFSDGDKYEGQWKDGEIKGQGIYIWKDGDKYDGGVIPNNNSKHQYILRNGNGTMTWTNGDQYIGDWKNDKKDGQGILTSKGNKYEGDWKNDKQNGSGEYTWKNGEVYNGDWKDGKQNGSGKMNYSDGNIYDGEWLDDKKNGTGTMKWPNGDKYIGAWVNDKRYGLGKKYTADGTIFDGEWINNSMNGRGTQLFPDKRKFAGVFKNGLVSIGKMIDPDGTVYEGEFIADSLNDNNRYTPLRNGKGICTYADGTKYDGHWKEGKKNGTGVLYDKSGKTLLEGTWTNGEFVEDK